jgi:hypothetical protein
MAVPISNVTRRIVFAPSGTGPYAFTFEILAATDIEVYKGDTLLTLTTDYTVAINANGTGSVTLVLTAGADNITIVGARAIERTTDFVTGGDFFANTVNSELDSLTIFAQQNAEAVTRSIQAPVTDPTTIDMTLPVKTDRAGKYLSFNVSTGNPEVVNTVVDVTTVAGIAANVTTVAGIAANVTTVAGVSADVTTVAGIAANVTTVAGVSANVTTVAGISADVTAVAGDAVDIGTVAGIAADVTSVAGISADVTAVAADATDIGTVATDLAGANTIGTVAGIAANVTTVAGISADVTTVAADGADIGAVAAIAANVTTVAGVAANVTTVAGISANVTTVAGISADVTTVATNVADITNFSDVYLGPAAADPTLRNDGSALQAGDLYFNTVSDVVKVYEGASWVAAFASLSGALTAVNNLSDLTDTSVARTNLGLSALATTTPGTNVATFLATPSSANLISAVTDETGTGLLVFATNPTLTGVTLAGEAACADNLVTRATLKDYAIEGSAIGNVGATRTFDLSVANFFSATVDQASTFTFSNPPASGDFGVFVLELTNGGAFAVTYPASVDFVGGVAPTLTAAGVDQLVFTTRDAGTTYLGFVAGLDIKSP